jgi:uncharacterized protein (TIGR02145 family)
MKILYCPKRFTRIKYGLLYNWYAALSAKNIAPSGWHLPSHEEFYNLMIYLDSLGSGGTNTAGGKLKETGLTYWNTPNTGATNESGFNARGSGIRYYDGVFVNIKGECNFWNSGETWNGEGYRSYLLYNSIIFNTTDDNGSFSSPKNAGYNIRLIMDGSDPTDPGKMTGNDGKIYRTVKIGTQVWMAANLAETEYRDGDAIPEVTGNADWAALTTGALCAYGNDWGNV